MKNEDKHSIGKALDSGSELNVISKNCFNRFQLKGEPITINIVGAGGVVSERCTNLTNITIVDNMGIETIPHVAIFRPGRTDVQKHH